MAQAIITKWVSPTDTKAQRIKVMGWMGNKMVEWCNNVDVSDNHALAVGEYLLWLNKDRDLESLEWRIVSGGSMPDNSGYAFIIDLIWK
jgi:hypothetical protein